MEKQTTIKAEAGKSRNTQKQNMENLKIKKTKKQRKKRQKKNESPSARITTRRRKPHAHARALA